MNGRKKIVVVLFALALCLGMIGEADAVLISGPLPPDVYITQNGLDWAWASPVNEQFFCCGNELMLPEFHEGWRFATDEEMAYLPSLADFGDGSIQAVEYWNTTLTHVDVWNYSGGKVSSSWGNGYWETIYVRGAGGYIDSLSDNSVPEPGTLLLLGTGIIGFSAWRKKLLTVSTPQ